MVLSKSNICLYYIKIIYVCRAVIESKGHKSKSLLLELVGQVVFILSGVGRWGGLQGEFSWHHCGFFVFLFRCGLFLQEMQRPVLEGIKYSAGSQSVTEGSLKIEG